MTRDRRALEKASDVLAGRLRPSVVELFELIHAINPTGRKAEPRRSSQTMREYEIKARLQSLLVRSYGDELRVEAQEDGTIAIAHRYSNRDGCHAQLDTLDDDARAWVRWQLDMNTASPDDSHAVAASPAPRGRVRDTVRDKDGEDDDDLLERGRRALAEYDFDVAVSAFRDALEQSGGDVAAARALLEVLVDSLAQDDEALALEEELNGDARADGDVQSLLGLAAARAGQRERAREWLEAAAGARAAEAWVVLARDALEHRAVPDAEGAVQRVEDADPAHPALAELRAGIVACRADARRPDEEALQALVAAGDDEAAERLARTLLARWPDSAVAGRTLAAIEGRRRARLGEESRLAAIEMLACGDFARAKEHAARAGALGVDVRELVARIDEAASQARAIRDTARVDELCALLRDGERRGLDAYLDLRPELRARIKERVSDGDVLGWLDELVPVDRSKLRPAVRSAAIAAALALREALAADGAGEHERALELVDRHPALGVLREARALRARAHETVSRQRQREAEAALDAAAAAWSERDTTNAARLLEQVDRRALGSEQRTRADRLADEVQRTSALEARMTRIDELVARNELLRARREIDALATIPEHDPAAARRLLESVRAPLRELWRVRSVKRGTFGARELGEVIGQLPRHPSPEPWVSADGHVVISAVHGCHVFIAAFEVGCDSATIHHVETPEPLGRYANRAVDRDSLWIGSDRHVIQIDWRTGDVMRWEVLAPFVPEEAVLEQQSYMPDARTLWLESRMKVDRECTLQVIDLERWSVARTLNPGRVLMTIPGDEPMVGALELDTGVSLYTGRGSSAGEVAQLRGLRIEAIVAHPTRPGYVAAASRRTDLDDEGGEMSVYEVVSGRPLRPIAISGTHPDATFCLLSARGHGVVFWYALTETGAELAGMRALPDRLEQTFRVAAPYEIELGHDPTSRRAFVAWESSDGVRVAELGDEPPSFGKLHELESFPALAPYFPCGISEPRIFDQVHELLETEKWSEALAQLEALDPAQIAPKQREHYHHLLGIAAIRTGDTARARQSWEEGLAVADPERFLSCQLEACMAIAGEVADERDATDDESTIVQVRRAIQRAAACRARGDIAGSLAALRQRCIYRARERQSLARLADTWLALPDPPDDAGAWFDKAQAFAQFLAVADTRARDVPIADAWDDARIREIANRVRAWFDRSGPSAS